MPIDRGLGATNDLWLVAFYVDLDQVDAPQVLPLNFAI